MYIYIDIHSYIYIYMYIYIYIFRVVHVVHAFYGFCNADSLRGSAAPRIVTIATARPGLSAADLK